MSGFKISLVALLLTSAALSAPRAPSGWQLSSTTPQGYQSGVDRETFHGGKASGYLQSLGSVPPRSFAILGQTAPAFHFQRSRVRMTGYIRTVQVTGWAGMWLRVDPQSGPSLEFDNMQNRPITGTTPWTRYSIELDVPAESASLNYGVLLTGTGQVWFDDVSFEPLGEALPAARLRQKIRGQGPENLGFEN